MKKRALVFLVILLLIIPQVRPSASPPEHISKTAAHSTLTLIPAENSISATAIDSQAGYAYFAAQTGPAVVVKLRLSDLRHEAALTLEDHIATSAIIDASSGSLYVGGNSGVTKVRLSDFSEVASLDLACCGQTVALIDEASGYAYFGSNNTPATISRLRLSDFTLAGTIPLSGMEGSIRHAFIDTTRGYAYFISDYLGYPDWANRIIKVRLSDFTRVGHLDVGDSFTDIYSAVADPSRGVAYLGTPDGLALLSLESFTLVDTLSDLQYFGDPAFLDPSGSFAYFYASQEIVKLRLSDMTVVDSILMDYPYTNLQTGGSDAGGDFAFLATFTAASPESVVKIRLSDMELLDSLTLNAGDDYLYSAVVDPQSGFAYFGTTNNPAGSIVKINLADFSRAAVLSPPLLGHFYSAAIDLQGGYAYFGTVTSDVLKVQLSDFSSADTIRLHGLGLRSLRSAVIDPQAGYLYFGTESPTLYSSELVYKIRLSDFTLVDELPLESGETTLQAAVIDTAGGYAYFGTSTAPGKIIRVDLSDFSRAGAITLDEGENLVRAGVIDTAEGYAYFGVMGKIIKIRLSDFSRVDSVAYGGAWPIESAAIDTENGLAYFGNGALPGQIITLRLSDFNVLDVYTLNQSEDQLRSGVFDPVTGSAYFGTYTFPGMIIKFGVESAPPGFSVFMPRIMH